MSNYSLTALLEAVATPESARSRLEEAWQAIYAELTARERTALGTVQVGKDASKPFAFTHRGDGSGANLCLEVSGGRIELNLVGWKMEQAAVMREWLMSRSAERALGSLTQHEVVVFLRTAYVKSADSSPYWQREESEPLATRAAAEYDVRWLSNVTRKDYGTATAFAYHIRRSWDPVELEASGDPLGELVAEVRRLMPLLAEINGAPVA